METKSYHLDTIVGISLAMPRQGEKKLTWTPLAVSDAAPKTWYSQEEIFRIEEKEDASGYPFGLNVKVLGGNY
jgi:hypothetical protein